MEFRPLGGLLSARLAGRLKVPRRGLAPAGPQARRQGQGDRR